MKSLRLTVLLGTVLFLAIGCGEKSPEQKLAGKWVVDQEWFAALPESGDKAEELYGIQAGMWDMTKAIAAVISYQFEEGAGASVSLGEEVSDTWDSWSVSEGVLHLGDDYSVPYSFTDDGKLQLVTDKDVPNFKITLVKAD